MRTATLISLLCISMVLASPINDVEETDALADTQEVDNLPDLDNMAELADSEDFSAAADTDAEFDMLPSGKKVAEAIAGQAETIIKKGISLKREYDNMQASAQAHADNQARRDAIIAKGPPTQTQFNHAKASQARYGSNK